MTEWFYSVDDVGRQGPVSVDELRGFLANKQLAPDALVWRAGMPQWREARDVPELAAPAPFFAVGTLKLVTMIIGTFGLYQIYWMYRHWQAIRTRTGEEMWPIARAIFAIFFFHALVREVNESANAQRIHDDLPVGGLTVLFILFTFSQRLPDPAWLVCFFVFVPLLIVQKRAGMINASVAPHADTNARIRGWNWAAIFIGLPLFVFAVWGTFLPA